MSTYDFRLNYRSNFNTLSFKVWDVLEMLTNHSVCQVVWFSYLVATDMVDILLCMAGVATQEIDINSYDTIDAVDIWLIVWAMLPELMLTEYSMYDGEISMLRNEWNLLLRKLECKEQDAYNDSHQTSRHPPIIAITKEQLYDKMKSINAHSQQFHPKADKYSCIDHLNITNTHDHHHPPTYPTPMLKRVRTHLSQLGSMWTVMTIYLFSPICQSYNMFMLDMIS
jgi:hypothetical protein